jgi:hypothetical protein
MPPLTRALAVLAVIGVIASSSPGQASKEKDAPPKLANQGAVPEVGEITLDYTFKNLMTGDGRNSLAAFRGNVVLIDWWGIH